MSAADLLQRITSDPAICHGKPCVRGLRYPVTFLLGLMSGGMSHEEILADYEDLDATTSSRPSFTPHGWPMCAALRWPFGETPLWPH